MANTLLASCVLASPTWRTRNGASATSICVKGARRVGKSGIVPHRLSGMAKARSGTLRMTNVAGSVTTSVHSRSGSRGSTVADVSRLTVLAEVTAALTATFRSGIEVAVALEVVVVVLGIAGSSYIAARYRQCERGLVLLHRIRNILHQAATRLPRILRWRISQPEDSVMLLSRAHPVIPRISTSRTSSSRIMVNDTFGNPAPSARRVDQRPRTITAEGRKVGPSGRRVVVSSIVETPRGGSSLGETDGGAMSLDAHRGERSDERRTGRDYGGGDSCVDSLRATAAGRSAKASEDDVVWCSAAERVDARAAWSWSWSWPKSSARDAGLLALPRPRGRRSGMPIGWYDLRRPT